jgi:hypothetical protein
MSNVSSDSIVIWLQGRWPEFNSWHRQTSSFQFHVQINSRACPTSYSTGTGIISLGVKWPTSSAKVKNARSYTSTYSYIFKVWCLIGYVFMIQCLIKYQEKVIFTFYFTNLIQLQMLWNNSELLGNLLESGSVSNPRWGGGWHLLCRIC